MSPPSAPGDKPSFLVIPPKSIFSAAFLRSVVFPLGELDFKYANLSCPSNAPPGPSCLPRPRFGGFVM